jgi:glycosyltransferase involved in cell wall biosynthesis
VTVGDPREKPRVIAAVGTWNEADFLPRWLRHVEKISDGVVAIDDGSTDATVDVLREDPLVIDLVTKRRGKRGEVSDRRRLTRMALDHGADWILFLDADEVFDGRIVGTMPELAGRQDVGEYRFRKYTLWRSEREIRVDRPEKFSAWSPCRMVRAARSLQWRYPEGRAVHRAVNVALGRSRWRPQYGHGEIHGVPGPVAYVPPEKVVLVHYASVSYPRMVWKQIRYAVGEAREHPRRNGDEIADYCFGNLDETMLDLAPLPAEWGSLP